MCVRIFILTHIKWLFFLRIITKWEQFFLLHSRLYETTRAANWISLSSVLMHRIEWLRVSATASLWARGMSRRFNRRFSITVFPYTRDAVDALLTHFTELNSAPESRRCWNFRLNSLWAPFGYRRLSGHIRENRIFALSAITRLNSQERGGGSPGTKSRLDVPAKQAYEWEIFLGLSSLYRGV